MQERIFFAYLHCRPDGTPFYVGKGHGKRHLNFTARNYYHGNVVKKHGRENVLVGKLDCSTEQIAFDLEVGLIKCLRRAGLELTNMTDGGEGQTGFVFSEESRAKMRESSKRRSPEVVEAIANAMRTPEARARVSGYRKGAKDSPETRARKSAAQLGKKQSKELIAKRSAALKGRVPGFAGRSHTEESKEKVAAAKRGKPLSEAHRAAIEAGHARRRERLATEKAEGVV